MPAPFLKFYKEPGSLRYNFRMGVGRSSLFLTLVVRFRRVFCRGVVHGFTFGLSFALHFPAWTAPLPPTIEPQAPQAPQASTAAPENPAAPEQLETLDIVAPPPPLRAAAKDRESFHPYRKALTFGAGSGYDTAEAEESEPGVVHLLSAQYLFGRPDRTLWEGGANLLSDGSGSLHVSRRFIYSQSRLRPYSKIGVGIRIAPEDKLVTVLEFEHYQLRAASGFEFSTRLNTSVRAETELVASGHSIFAGVMLGHVWAY